MTRSTKIQPHWLNRKQIAASIGISVVAFDKWGVEPVAKVGRETFYEVKDVIANRLDSLQEKINQGISPGDPESIEYQRLRLTKEQADNLELKNEMARAKVIPIDLFTEILSRVAGEIAGIIDTLPLQIKRKHPGLETAVIEGIKWQCVKAQNAMARVDSVADQVIEDYVARQEAD